ncbi:MAG: cell division protein FtsA [Patescibacteria group bacterium]|nr:cell division protein FtsA [Patescibacteria group bacterium]
MAKNIITAIDVGSSKICTIIAAVSEGSDTLQVIGVYNSPSVGVKKGVIVNIDEATNAIAESVAAAERMAGITVSSVYATIGGKHITSLNSRGVVAASHDDISEDDTFRAIENARTISIPPSREILHIVPREFLVDSQGGIKDPIGMSGSRLEVDTHIISATTTALQNLVKCIQQNGLGLEDVVFVGWSSSHAVLTGTEKDLGVTLLDIGGDTTSICIFQEGAISYSGCVPLGGSSITSDLAIGLQMSLDDAEKLKSYLPKLIDASGPEEIVRDEDMAKPAISRRRDSDQTKEDKKSKKKSTKKDKDLLNISNLDIDGHDTVSKTMCQKVIEARLEEIFEIISTQVGQAGFDASTAAGVVLTGGSSKLYGIKDIAQKSFGVPSRLGVPSGLSGMIEEISGPEFSACQGLIKHALVEDVESTTPGRSVRSSKFSIGDIFSKLTGWIKSLLP